MGIGKPEGIELRSDRLERRVLCTVAVESMAEAEANYYRQLANQANRGEALT